MKFITFNYKGNEEIGVMTKDDKKIIIIKDVFGESGTNNMMEFIENFFDKYEERLINIDNEEKCIDIGDVTLEAPIPEPRRGVICLGKNYKEHVKEVPSTMDLKNGLPENPIYFCKLVDKSLGNEEKISLHEEITKQLDYEVELAVIMGKRGKDIPYDKVEEYIFGYTILNDISIRDIQTKHVQWFKGKSFDGTCPIGPWIVDKRDIKFPIELDIECYVNGELRQKSNTKELIFDIPYIISEFSKGTTLKPGDIISTGTPAGVGMGFKPPKFLKAGDEIKCYIEKIGTLTNIVDNK
ncbi:fumarylacetoacetate hydrolase family protein [Clostridium sp. JNZ J1-5]